MLGNWKPDKIALVKLNDTTWGKTFNFNKNELVEFKFTRGSLATESVSPKGAQYYNVNSFCFGRDTSLTINIPGWMDIEGGVTNLTAAELNDEHGFKIANGWRFHSGDDSAWAKPEVNDNNWEIIYTTLNKDFLPVNGWTGIGWFRLHLKIDSSLYNKPLALHLWQTGASEIYLDGKLIYKFGKVGSTKENEVSFEDMNPKVIIFDSKPNHLLSVRYSNFTIDYYNHKKIYGGFIIYLGELNKLFSIRADYIRSSTISQMIFTSVPAAFALMHLFLFFFYPKFKENFYYAVCMLGFSVITFAEYQTIHSISVAQIILFIQIGNVAKYIAIIFGLFMVYSMSLNRIPKYSLFFIIPGTIVSVWTTIQPFDIGNYAGDILLVAAIIEMLRLSFRKNRKNELKENSVVLAGFCILCITLIYQLLVAYNVINPIGNLKATYLYGALALSISMSIHLSRKFAKTKNDLEYQLVQVKELSKQAIEHERIAKEQEIQQRLLEADNSRKTLELEEARKLQLSMLPKDIPSLPHLKISAFMKTAKEVGGDYYDFHIDANNILTAVIGDATGHGIRAGTMVTAAKSLFNEYAGISNIATAFEKFTKSFKLLNFDKLYMAMLMIKITDHKLTGSSAGMPAPLIYRAETNDVEILPLKGMPLGCFDNFPYNSVNTNLNKGDSILLMSDGYPELFNENNDILDYDNVKNIFKQTGSLMPDQIIEKLLSEGAKWAGERLQDDDITFVVIKVTE